MDETAQQALLPKALNTSSAALYVAHSAAFLKKARRGKTDIPGPAFRKIGKRVIYLREDLDSWLDQFEPMATLPNDASVSNSNKHPGSTGD